MLFKNIWQQAKENLAEGYDRSTMQKGYEHHYHQAEHHHKMYNQAIETLRQHVHTMAKSAPNLPENDEQMMQSLHDLTNSVSNHHRQAKFHTGEANRHMDWLNQNKK